MGWFWFILPALLAAASWLAPSLYVDHLVRQGRYDQALRLVPILAMTELGRSRRRADLLIEAGQYDEAERVIRPIVDRLAGKGVPNLTRVKACFDLEDLGKVLMETGRFDEAQRRFRDAANKYPYHSVWAAGMAEVLLRQGVFPKSALGHAEKALNLFQHGQERFTSSSQIGPILATRAWALAACGRGIEAQKAIDAALTSSARKTKGPLAQVHFKAGMSLLALSDNRGAEEHFARGAEIDPAGRWGQLCANALQRQKYIAQIPPVEG